MGRLMMEGDYFFELGEEERPHEYMVDAKHGQVAKHSEFGEVLIRNTPEIGWHYVRWGYAGHGKDWENLKTPKCNCNQGPHAGYCDLYADKGPNPA